MLISKRKYDRDDRTERIIEKQMRHIRAGQTFKLKFGCTVGANGLIHMECVCCLRSLPRDTLHYSVSRGARNFWTCEPGHEWLNNSKSSPCLTCKKMRTTKRGGGRKCAEDSETLSGVPHVKGTCTVAGMFQGTMNDFRCAMTGFDLVARSIGVTH